jgi:hypothetical protein
MVRPTLNRGNKISDHGFLEKVDRDNKFTEQNLGLRRLSACTITSENRERHAAPHLSATLSHRLPPLFLPLFLSTLHPPLLLGVQAPRRGQLYAPNDLDVVEVLNRPNKKPSFLFSTPQHPSCLDEAVLGATHHHMANLFLPLLAYPAALRGSSQVPEPELLRPARC